MLAITDAELERPSIVGGASIYPFVQNVLLGLRHEGLGSAFTTLLLPAEPQLRDLLNIPTGMWWPVTSPSATGTAIGRGC